MLELLNDPRVLGEVVEMGKMKPLEYGIVVDDKVCYGDLVMRTASSTQFEVMDLSDPEDGSWVIRSDLKVQLITTPLRLTIFN